MQVGVKRFNSPTASSFPSHATNTQFTTKLKNVLSSFLKHDLNFFFSQKNLKPTSVDFKFSTMKLQVSDNLNTIESSIFQFSVSEFHHAKSRSN